MAMMVAPEARNQGVGHRALLAMENLPALELVDTVIGAVEQANVAAQRRYRAAGYAVANPVDEEGMLGIRQAIRA